MKINRWMHRIVTFLLMNNCIFREWAVCYLMSATMRNGRERKFDPILK